MTFSVPSPPPNQKYAVDIDALAKEYLGLDVSYRTLSEDGSVLGVTAYSDTAYTCKLNGEGIVVPLKRSHILIDRRLLGFYGPKKNRRRRFTLAHECAHQILFQLEAPEVQAACRSKYRAVAYSLRELKSHVDWNEWQGKRPRRGRCLCRRTGLKPHSGRCAETSADRFRAAALRSARGS